MFINAGACALYRYESKFLANIAKLNKKRMALKNCLISY